VQSYDATTAAFAALSFTGTNSFLRATAADTFVAEDAAAHRSALDVPGLSVSNIFAGDIRINGGQLYFDGTTTYLNYSATNQIDIVTDNTTRIRVDATGLVTINNAMVVGTPTGGNKGTGTINAQAVYDDNVLLTDLVLDYAVTNTFDEGKYANHPLKDQVAPWWFDADQYADFWRANRHLPGMVQFTPETKPSTGESITRLTAVVETQAALIESLNRRLKALER
jgi:hypothetical protein